MNSGRGLGLLVGFVVGGAIASSGDCALGQSRITPDNTLGAESSTVVPNYQGLPVEVIAGGAGWGGNLFHSFLEFNVSAGRGAYFYSSNAGIQNILARVTGSNSFHASFPTAATAYLSGIFGSSGYTILLQATQFPDRLMMSAHQK